MESDFTAGRYHGIMVKMAQDAFEGEYKAKRVAAREEDPLERFLLAHTERPGAEELLRVFEKGDKTRMNALISEMSADDWKRYSGSVSVTDARSIFAFLARSEVRKQGGFAPEGSAPLLNQD